MGVSYSINANAHEDRFEALESSMEPNEKSGKDMKALKGPTVCASGDVSYTPQRKAPATIFCRCFHGLWQNFTHRDGSNRPSALFRPNASLRFQ